MRIFEKLEYDFDDDWEELYDKGNNLGLCKYIEELTDLRDSYQGFQNAPLRSIKKILSRFPLINYEICSFWEELLDYFGINF